MATSATTLPLIHRVVKKLPSAPNWTNIQRLLRPPDDHALVLHSAYIIPTNLAPLLDCLTDSPADARDHLDSLGVRPAWRHAAATKSSNDTQAEAAAKALAPRLRTMSQSGVLVLLFSPPRRAVSRDASGHDVDSPRSVEQQDLGTQDARPATTVEAVNSRPAVQPRRRRTVQRPPLSTVASTVSHGAGEGYLEPLARPCTLQPRTHEMTAALGHAAPAEASEGEAAGVDEGSLHEAVDALGVDEGVLTARGGARDVLRRLCGPSAMHSRHTLPSSGNWVRLSAAQQHCVRVDAQLARRRAAEGAARGAAGGIHSFGSEPRLSGSRTWAHQTGNGRTCTLATLQASELKR